LVYREELLYIIRILAEWIRWNPGIPESPWNPQATPQTLPESADPPSVGSAAAGEILDLILDFILDFGK